MKYFGLVFVLLMIGCTTNSPAQIDQQNTSESTHDNQASEVIYRDDFVEEIMVEDLLKVTLSDIKYINREEQNISAISARLTYERLTTDEKYLITNGYLIYKCGGNSSEKEGVGTYLEPSQTLYWDILLDYEGIMDCQDGYFEWHTDISHYNERGSDSLTSVIASKDYTFQIGK